MTVVLILAGLLGVGVVAMFVSALTAPYGYEDETGFHLGVEPRSKSAKPAEHKLAA